MNLFLDVETVPSMHPAAKDEIRATIKPPATYKKPESIAQWFATEAEAAIEAEWRKQALDSTVGELIAIGLCDDGDRAWVRCRKPGESEAELLRDAFCVVELWTEQDAERLTFGHSDAFPVDDHTLIGHNLAFDAGYLWRRARVHDVPVPRWLPPPMRHRPSERFVCTMQEWAGWGQRISLDRLCRALGIASPKAEGFDGSQVFDAWIAGEADRIASYCLKDAKAAREVFHIIRGLPRTQS